MSLDNRSTPVAPDGGYGWVVVVMACLANAITVNTNTFFAMLFVDLPVTLNQSQNAVGWISSIRQGVASLIGMIAGSLVDVYGCRTVCVVGGFLQGAGYLLSSFATDVYAMYLTYGVIAGVGFGMTLVASTVVVQQYFSLRRPFAAGMAAAGISVGGLVLAPSYQLVFSNYGWRGAFLILSALHLNLVACGLAFIPLPAGRISPKRAESIRVGEVEEIKIKDMDEDQNATLHPENARALFVLKRSIAEEEGQDFSTSGKLELDKQIILHSIAVSKIIDKGNSDKCRRETACSTVINSRLLKNFRDTSLLRELDFILIALAVAMSTAWATVIFSMLYGYAIWKGASATIASLMISVCPLCTLISRITSSVVVNLQCINRSLLYSLALLYGALVLALSFLAGTSVYVIGVFFGLYGISIGIAQTIAVTNLSDLFGVHRVAKGYGWVQTFSALFGFTAMPIVGLIIDETNNYDLVYAIIGIVFFTSGILAFVPFIRRFRKTTDAK